jgi:hypothetical protein
MARKKDVLIFGEDTPDSIERNEHNQKYDVE